MKKRYFNRLHILITAALLLAPSMASAQESIKNLNAEYSTESIIREIWPDEWLVYSNCGSCNFCWVQDWNSSVNFISLPDTIKSISDFEIDIDGDKVYFCGMMSDGVPCMGYFKISTFYSFTTTTIYFIRFPRLKKIKKLEVMSDNSGTQVVMTAISANKSYIVDVISNPPGWTIIYIEPHVNAVDLHIVEDITITDNYVVFSSLMGLFDGNEDLVPPARLWFFTKPAAAHVSLSYSTLTSHEIPLPLKSPFLVKKCENDIFVAAGASGTGELHVIGYNATFYVGTAKIKKNNMKLKDISYNTCSKTTDVILDTNDAGIIGSEIYTILPGMSMAPGVTYGHMYPGYVMNSHIYNPSNPLQYVCTGHNLSNTFDLFLAQYLYHYPFECSSLITADTEPISIIVSPDPAYIEKESIYTPTKYVDAEHKRTYIQTICTNNK